MAADPADVLPPGDVPDGVEVVELTRDVSHMWMELVSWRYGLGEKSAEYLIEAFRATLDERTRVWVAMVDGQAVSKVASYRDAPRRQLGHELGPPGVRRRLRGRAPRTRQQDPHHQGLVHRAVDVIPARVGATRLVRHGEQSADLPRPAARHPPHRHCNVTCVEASAGLGRVPNPAIGRSRCGAQCRPRRLRGRSSRGPDRRPEVLRCIDRPLPHSRVVLETATGATTGELDAAARLSERASDGRTPAARNLHRRSWSHAIRSINRRRPDRVSTLRFPLATADISVSQLVVAWMPVDRPEPAPRHRLASPLGRETSTCRKFGTSFGEVSPQERCHRCR